MGGVWSSADAQAEGASESSPAVTRLGVGVAAAGGIVVDEALRAEIVGEMMTSHALSGSSGAPRQRHAETVLAALDEHRSELSVARHCCKTLRDICMSNKGRDAVRACVLPTAGAPCLAINSISAAIVEHFTDVELLEHALEALSILVLDSPAVAGQYASIEASQSIAMRLLQRHPENPAIVKPALSVLWSCTAFAPVSMHRHAAAHDGAALALQALAKHMDMPSLASKAASLLYMLMMSPDTAATLSRNAETLPVLMAALRHYTDDARAAADSAAHTVVGSALSCMARLAAESVASADELVAGGNAFYLVAGMRKHMANQWASEQACRLLAALPETPSSAPEESSSRCSRLVTAGAVTVLLDMMSLHEGGASAAMEACSAFAAFADDAPTLLQLAEERPVLLLRSLLRRYQRDAKVMAPLAYCIAAVGRSDSCATRALLMGGGGHGGGAAGPASGAGAVDTLRLLVEASRIHRGNGDVVITAARALGMLLKTYDDYLAAHKAGAGAVALTLLRELPDCAPAAMEACNLIALLASCAEARHQLSLDGAPAAVVQVIKRHPTDFWVASTGCTALRVFVNLPAYGPVSTVPDEATLAAIVKIASETLERFTSAPLTTAIDHGKCADVVAQAAACIAGVGKAKANIAVCLGSVPLLARALRLHANDAAAASSTVEAIAVFAQSPTKKGVGAVAAAKLLPDLLAALEKHSTNSMVSITAHSTITALESCPGAAAAVAASVPAILKAAARTLRDEMAAAPGAGLPENVMAVSAAIGTLVAISIDRSRVPTLARVPDVVAALLSFLHRFCADARALDAESMPLSAARATAIILSDAAVTCPECRALLRSLRAQELTPLVLATLAASRVRGGLRHARGVPAGISDSAKWLAEAMQLLERALAKKPRR